jgi:phage gp16-like protein
MYAMHEVLAREHMRQSEAQARQRQLAAELSAANRWQYLERRARAAHQRHSRRLARVTQLSAVAD